MKIFSKLSALGAVLVLSTAFASADTLQLGSFAQNGGNGGLPNTNLVLVTAPAFAVVNALPQQFPSEPIGETQFLSVTNNSVWNTPLGNSSWVSYAQTGPEPIGPFVTAPNGNYFFQTSINIGADDPTLETGFLDVQADDTVIVFLNGHQLNTPSPDTTDPGSFPHCLQGTPTCTAGTMIDFGPADFVAGVNTFTFQVIQANDADFGVDFTGAISTVPEPSSLFLLGSGLIGSAGALLRRRRRS